MRIAGRTALITGGASGLGRATAQALRSAGASVVILDRSPSEPSDDVLSIQGDVTVEDDVARALDTAIEEHGGLSIAVNCAGIGAPRPLLNKEGDPHPLETFEDIVKVNVTGTFNVIRLAAARMAKLEPVEGERGVIVNTSSTAAFDGQGSVVAYSASKAAIVGMTLPIARDLASRGIRCVTVAPGSFATPILDERVNRWLNRLVEATPHPHRLGDPCEFASLVLQIVENPMINGETIRLDGALRAPWKPARAAAESGAMSKRVLRKAMGKRR